MFIKLNCDISLNLGNIDYISKDGDGQAVVFFNNCRLDLPISYDEFMKILGVRNNS